MAPASRKQSPLGIPSSYWDRRGRHLPFWNPGLAVMRSEWVCPLPPAGLQTKRSAWKRYFVPEMGFVCAVSRR